MADEELGQTPTLTQTATPSTGPDFPPDPDSKPIGRCYAEQMATKAAVMALRAAQQRVRETVSAFGDCRARAAASAGDFASANQSDFDMITTGLFDMMGAQLTDLENLISRECSDCLTDDNDKQTDITE